jgi:hypothetical protein
LPWLLRTRDWKQRQPNIKGIFSANFASHILAYRRFSYHENWRITNNTCDAPGYKAAALKNCQAELKKVAGALRGYCMTYSNSYRRIFSPAVAKGSSLAPYMKKSMKISMRGIQKHVVIYNEIVSRMFSISGSLDGASDNLRYSNKS